MMESMKVLVSVFAPIAGEVVKVCVQEGMVVGERDVLVQLREALS